jgi:hypothetical protein
VPRDYTEVNWSKQMQLEGNHHSEGNGSRGKGIVEAVTRKRLVETVTD